jgi:hypothetical protein
MVYLITVVDIGFRTLVWCSNEQQGGFLPPGCAAGLGRLPGDYKTNCDHKENLGSRILDPLQGRQEKPPRYTFSIQAVDCVFNFI